jgi:tetratricopeptide (TPR) repeat protein
LTSTNVNGSSQYFFLLRPRGEWIPDEDFITEELPKLSIVQGGAAFSIQSTGELSEQDSSILLGFSKQLKIIEPFVFKFDLEDSPQTAEMTVPLILWPRYDDLQALVSRSRSTHEAHQYREAIAVCDQILSDQSFAVFPQLADVRSERIRMFAEHLASTVTATEAAVSNPKLKLKDKIADVESKREEVRFVSDSLTRKEFSVTPGDPTVDRILADSKVATARIAHVRDSLQVALDEETIKWIIYGSATGRSGFEYQHIIEALAYAFSSIDFADTSATNFTVTIPDDQQERLEKDKSVEAYETFLNTCRARFSKRVRLYPDDFLQNVQKDTAAFALPLYSMLRVVDEYYQGEFESATALIFSIFRTCTDPELNARFDRMRVLIRIRIGSDPPEALQLLSEAARAEAAGNSGEALSKYHQATIIGPSFPYASFCLGEFYVRSGDPIRALPFFQRAYQLDSLYLSAYLQAVQLYRRSGNYKPMIEVLTQAKARGNDYWEISFNLGLAYLGDADPARAIQNFEHALELNGRSYETNIQLGLAYQSIKEYQRARQYFNNAINIDPLRQAAVDFLNKLNELQRSAR